MCMYVQCFVVHSLLQKECSSHSAPRSFTWLGQPFSSSNRHGGGSRASRFRSRPLPPSLLHSAARPGVRIWGVDGYLFTNLFQVDYHVKYYILPYTTHAKATLDPTHLVKVLGGSHQLLVFEDL